MQSGSGWQFAASCLHSARQQTSLPASLGLALLLCWCGRPATRRLSGRVCGKLKGCSRVPCRLLGWPTLQHGSAQALPLLDSG